MKDLQETLNSIKDKQATIDVLLDLGQILKKSQNSVKDVTELYEKKWVVETIYNLNDCSLGFAYCEEIDGIFPEHIHKNVQEYLICTQGAFIETFGSNGNTTMRIVRPGECVSIPPNTIHSSKPLERKTRMVFICVPKDKNIP